jgi:general secretion pathway protein N
MKWVLGGFAALLVLAGLAVWIAPLGLVVARTAPELTAREMTGSVWKGHLADAAWRGTPLGDLNVALDPGELLAGRVRIDWVRGGSEVTGRLGVEKGQTLLERLNGRVGVPVPLPFADSVDIGLQDAALTLDAAGRCVSAGGQVATVLTGLPMIGTSPELRGVAACDGEWLMLPLRSVDGRIGLDVRLTADRRFRADVDVQARAIPVRLALAAAGFEMSRDRARFGIAGTL